MFVNKFVQIAVSTHGRVDILYALDEDGRVWRRIMWEATEGDDPFPWRRMSTPDEDRQNLQDLEDALAELT